MRTILRRLTACAALAIAFAAGALTAARSAWLQPIVTLDIVNHSGQAITGLQLDMQSSQQHLQSELGGLEAGQVRTVRVVVTGEAGYQIRARLADGRVLDSRGGYAESGYAVQEEVTASGIVTRY